MPVNIAPVTLTLDKVRINQFTVDTNYNTITIYYSKGYEDGSGNFVTVEHARADLSDINVSPTLYSDVKTALYVMLNDHLSA